MPYSFNIMSQQEAEEIALTWQYDAPYDFYNMEEDEEDLVAFLDEKERGEFVFSVKDEEELIAFLMIEQMGDSMDLGLGMTRLNWSRKRCHFLKGCDVFYKNEL
ncbi:hypothetical protein MKX78_01655 [Cytobacillus sp. FSL R5-0569]|uniref:hypothetical protein n=1 Tax=Cytobacillus TaxID=2675230 RepID=UPI00277F1156|nr:hypothetical protein [Cytobacillus kochii]MDQ0185598.1 hypothetical protein [Cytobacillus kochii]